MTYTPTTRLPNRSSEPSGSRRQDVLKGIAAIIGAVLLVVVVPVLLVALVGNPFAGFLGTPGTVLTAGLDTGMIIDVFVIVLWIAWAWFTLSLVVEFVRFFRNRRLSGHGLAPGGGGILTRRMVASIMLLLGAASITPSFQGLASDSAVDRAAAAEYERSSHELEVVQSNVAASEARIEAAAAAPDGAAAADGSIITYVVQPQQGRHYDTLWDISERYLGDGMRYKEIYQLNKDKEQPDGTRLRDADLIYPGWTLHMPADARGEGLHVFTPSSAAAVFTADGTRSAAGASAAQSTAGAAGAQDDAAVHAEEAAAHSAAARSIDTGLPEALADASSPHAGVRHALGGGLLAAGLLLALTARRGPFAEVSDERMLRLAENTELAFDLDRALRSLALGCRETGTALPEATVVMAGPDNVVLHHASGANPTPPWPWRRVEEGTAWIVDLADVPAEQAAVPAPYPALVNVASAAGYEILLDLESAPGLVSLDGDELAARESLMSMAAELATNVWSDGVAVDMVGFGTDLSALAPDRIRAADSLTAILDEIEADLSQTSEIHEKLGISGILAGRSARTPERARPRVVFCSAAPTADELERINALLGRGRTPLAVVGLGRTAGSRWVARVTGEELAIDVFNLHGTARRLSAAQADELAGLFRHADTARAAAESELSSTSSAAFAQRAAARVLGDPESPDTPGGGALPVPAVSSSALRSALVDKPAAALRVLGPVVLEAPGPVDPATRPLLTELVTAVALHPAGLHDAVLRSLVWPRGVGDSVVESAIADARTWLGRTPSGGERLRTLEDGRWTLDESVLDEWRLLHQVAGTGYGTAGELDLYGLLFTRARGSLLDTGATGRYAWIAFHSARRDARVIVVRMAERAVELCLQKSNRTGAVWFLERALELVPTAERLWRRLLELTSETDPDGAAAVAATMYRTLSGAGVSRPEAETDALVGQLAPSIARETA